MIYDPILEEMKRFYMLFRVDPDASGTDVTYDKARLSFGDNYPRLQAIKKRYDPRNIFNKWFPIVPA